MRRTFPSILELALPFVGCAYDAGEPAGRAASPIIDGVASGRPITGLATPHDLITMRLTLPPQKYGSTDGRQQFFRQLSITCHRQSLRSANTLSVVFALMSSATGLRTLKIGPDNERSG